MNKELLFKHNEDWTFETMSRVYDAVQEIVDQEIGFTYYPNQIEVVTSEQMLDSYATVGLPIFYDHWSFGKEFEQNRRQYQAGQMGLAYELVINSNPCISYNMETNTPTMMSLVIAHAAFGHNGFFKNNFLFKQWTDASAIVDYLTFAKRYIQQCEEKYGLADVELTLDACHALQNYGVDKYKRAPKKMSEEAKAARKHESTIENYDDVWSKTTSFSAQEPQESADGDNHEFEPEENILYFLEKNSPTLQPWQREIVRIVRKVAQYFYPQAQTKVSNEGFATFVHHYVMNRLHETGQIDNGSYLEFIASHTNVVAQPEYNSKYYSGFNPYALGFAIYSDIKRICTNPTEEDKQWFPKLIGRPWNEVIIEAMSNYKDESFIQQWLSPKVMRDLGIFVVADDYRESEYVISAIHDAEGYQRVRNALANAYNRGNMLPDIQVVRTNMKSSRELVLQHFDRNDIPLDAETAKSTLQYVQFLWGFDVRLETIQLSNHGARNRDYVVQANPGA